MKRVLPAVLVVAALGVGVAVAQSGWASNELPPQQAYEMLQQDRVVVVDVRTPGEYVAGHVDEAINVPLGQIRARVEDVRRLARERPVVLYCRSGRRARIAERILADQGVDPILHLDGQLSGWRAAGLPVSTGAR